MDFLGNGVEFVERLQARGDTENSCIVFDHVKRFKDWTTMACHVYDIKYCKVMTIACCDMQSKDDVAHTLFGRIWMPSWQRTVCQLQALKVSWQTTHKKIGMQWKCV